MSASITSFYTLGGATLKHDVNKMVIYQSRVSPAGIKIDYDLYASGVKEFHSHDIKVKEKDENKCFISLYERKSLVANLVRFGHRRRFDYCGTQKKP